MGCRKTLDSYQGIASAIPNRGKISRAFRRWRIAISLCQQPLQPYRSIRLFREGTATTALFDPLFSGGHGFSRADRPAKNAGFSP